MKKGILYFLVAFIVLGIVFFKLSDVYADEEEDEVKKCEPETRTYLFSEASRSSVGKTTTYDTTFYNDLPDDARVLSITVVDKHAVNESEFEKLITIPNNSSNCTNNGYGYKDVCRDNGYYTNSGVEGQEGYHGSGESNINEYFNNNVVFANSDSIQVSFTPGDNHVLYCTITRGWNTPKQSILNKLQSDSEYMYLIPLAVTVKIEYESADCIEEDDDADDPTDNECPPDSVSSNDLANKDLDCTGANYKQTKNERNLTVTRTISTSDSDHGTYYKDFDKGRRDDGTDYCSRELTEKITWDAALTQEGYLNFNLNPRSQYSGGGFDFTIDYNANAYYELCGATYDLFEYKALYSCPSISDSSSSSNYGNGMISEYTSVSSSGGGENPQCTYTYNTTETLTVPKSYYDDNPELYDQKCRSSITCSSAQCTCTVSSSSTSNTVDANFDQCKLESSGTYSCFEGHDSPGIDCSNNSNEVKEIASKMATFLQESQITNSNPESYNSNDVTSDDRFEDMGGEWNANSVRTNSWLPAQTIRYSASYRIKHACINRFTAFVDYKNSCDDNTEIDGGNLYYIPLKQPDGDFPVRVYTGGNATVKISILNNMDWGFIYDCDVSCRQELFDLHDGGYLYFFRPIALDNPFPNNRTPGANWQDWIFFEMNRERLIDTYSTTNNIEYIVYLENEDVNAIKQYNSNTTYLDYSNSFHNKEGNSEFINTRFNYLFDPNVNTNHSLIGEYNPEDDKQ